MFAMYVILYFKNTNEIVISQFDWGRESIKDDTCLGRQVEAITTEDYTVVLQNLKGMAMKKREVACFL
jgi:hypothetical protein